MVLYAREGWRSSLWWWNHRLRMQPHCCSLLGPPLALASSEGHLQHPQPMCSMSQSPPSHKDRPPLGNPSSTCQGSWHSFRDQIRGLRVNGGKKGKKANTNPQEWDRAAHSEWMSKQQAEAQIMALVKRSGPRASSHQHKRGAHLKEGCKPTGQHPNCCLICAVPI